MRSWGRTLVEWLGVAALSLIVAEVALRVVHVQPLTPGQFVFEHHPTRGWTHCAGANDEYVKPGARQQIDINARGLRERDLSYQKPASGIRLLVIGDSHVVGFEVAQSDTFTRVAERLLRDRGHEVEIVNGGFRGYGTGQALLFLEDEGLRYEPDIILYVFGANDPQDNVTIHRPFRAYGKGYFDLDAAGELVLMGTPVPDFAHASSLKVGDDGQVLEIEVPLRTRTLLWARDLSVTRSSVATALANIVLVLPSFWEGLRGVAAYQDSHPVLDRDSRLFRVTAALIGRMERNARAPGSEFRIVGAEGPWGTALAAATQVEGLDVLPRFQASVPKGTYGELLVPFDSHLNEAGHRLYGEALAASLVEPGLAGPLQREH